MSWVLFTISRNWLYRGSLYRGLSSISHFSSSWHCLEAKSRLQSDWANKKNTRTDLGHVLNTKIILHLKCIAIYSKYLGGMYIGYIKKLLWIVAIREYCDENSKKILCKDKKGRKKWWPQVWKNLLLSLFLEDDSGGCSLLWAKTIICNFFQKLRLPHKSYFGQLRVRASFSLFMIYSGECCIRQFVARELKRFATTFALK